MESTAEKYYELRDFTWDTNFKSISQVKELSSKARTFYNSGCLRKLSTLDAVIQKSINGVRKSFEDYANKQIMDLQRNYKSYGCSIIIQWEVDHVRDEINEFYSQMADPCGKYNEFKSKLDKIESYIPRKHHSSDWSVDYIYYE